MGKKDHTTVMNKIAQLRVSDPDLAKTLRSLWSDRINVAKCFENPSQHTSTANYQHYCNRRHCLIQP